MCIYIYIYMCTCACMFMYLRLYTVTSFLTDPISNCSGGNLGGPGGGLDGPGLRHTFARQEP